jgi:hypothetical protein
MKSFHFRRGLRLSNSIRILMLTLLLSVAAIPAHADGVSNPMYSVTGLITLQTGTNACTSSPCAETINFALDLGFRLGLGPAEYDAYVVNATAIWSGDIGTFVESAPSLFLGAPIQARAGGCSGGDTNYIEFFNQAGDEVNAHLCDNAEPTPVVPSLSYADLYHCKTTTCVNDFDPFNFSFMSAALTDVTVTRVPEPSILILLASAMLALGLLGATHRRSLI